MSHESPTAQKSRSGLSRILHAGGYSLAGLKAGWNETAFRQEALLAMVMIPAAFWVGRHWLEDHRIAQHGGRKNH
jgi:diacylglycerol kinase (ATP)